MQKATESSHSLRHSMGDTAAAAGDVETIDEDAAAAVYRQMLLLKKKKH
jgi:hypothetical protein